MKKNIMILKSVAVFLSILVLGISTLHAEKIPISVGVWAVHGTNEAALLYKPTIDYLNQAMPDYKFKLEPVNYKDFLDLENSKQINPGAFDFIIMDQALYERFKVQNKAEPVLMWEWQFKGKSYVSSAGVLFSKKESGIQHASMLKDKSFAAPPIESLSGWMSIANELRKLGLEPKKIGLSSRKTLATIGLTVAHLSNEQEVMKAVLEGKVDVGAVSAGTLEKLAARGGVKVEDFNIISLTPEQPNQTLPVQTSTALYPEWILASCSKGSQAIVNQVAAKLLLMPGQPEPASPVPTFSRWTIPQPSTQVQLCMQTLHVPPYEKTEEITVRQVLKQYGYYVGAGGVFVVLLLVLLIYVVILEQKKQAEVYERRNAEKALNESNIRFESLSKCSGDWIWEYNALGKFVYSNANVEQMLNYTPDELRGVRMVDLLSKAEKEKLGSAIKNGSLGSGDIIFRQRLRFTTKSGHVVVHEVTAEPVFISKVWAGYRGVSRDVTSDTRLVRL